MSTRKRRLLQPPCTGASNKKIQKMHTKPGTKRNLTLVYKQQSGRYSPFANNKIAVEIQKRVDEGNLAFCLRDDITRSLYLIDLETMQRHNINTGKHEPILLIEATHKTKCIKNINHGARNEGGGLFGFAAKKMLTQIRASHLQRSSFITETKRLPKFQQLINPVPMKDSDTGFPGDQIKFLRRPGVTVHAVQPTCMWKRNRRCFDLLLAEEQQLFRPHATESGLPKLKHFAWHGAPVRCIKGILGVGFLSTPKPRVGNMYGHGVYLATEQNARYCLHDRFSEPDENGFKYILLCEILPGSVEVSKRGQLLPTNKSAHSGVDQLPGASIHVFYTYDMNVRISPKFVICIHPNVPLSLNFKEN